MNKTLYAVLSVLLTLSFVVSSISCGADKKGEKAMSLQPGLYAIFHTSEGTITCTLFEKEAPKTVANLIGLAEGTKEWTDPKTGNKVKTNFYDGLIFHRIIPDFMIQGGDPEGTGRGGPGYSFEDEFQSGLKFDKPGRLAMANAGPNTNGSQFFITHVPTPHLNNGHTIFGQVIIGQDVVDNMGKLKRDRGDTPLEDVVLNKLEIKRVE